MIKNKKNTVFIQLVIAITLILNQGQYITLTAYAISISNKFSLSVEENVEEETGKEVIESLVEENVEEETDKEVIESPVEENVEEETDKEVIESPIEENVEEETGKEVIESPVEENVEEETDKEVIESLVEENVEEETGKEVIESTVEENVEEETGKEVIESTVEENIEEDSKDKQNEYQAPVIVQFNCYGTCTNTKFTVYDEPSENANQVSEFNSVYMNDAQYLDETEEYFKVYYSGVHGWVRKVDMYDHYVLTAEPRTQSIVKVASNEANNIIVDALSINDYLENSASQKGQRLSSMLDYEIIFEETQRPKEAVLPTIYTVEAGDLLVCYTTAADDITSNRYCISLSQAPNYLNEGGTYYSYDGVYFYDVLSELSIDGTDAINHSNPNYNYFQYLPVRAASNYTTEDFIEYLNSVGYTQNLNENDIATIGSLETKPNSDGYYPIKYNTVTVNGISKQKCTYSNKVWVLATGGQCVSKNKSMLLNSIESYKNYESNRGINSILEFAWAIHESGYGTSAISIFKNNFFGMGAYDSCAATCSSVYKTPGDGINAHIDQFVYRYSHPLDWRYYGSHVGDGVSGMNVKYASDKQWGAKIASILYNIDKYLGGDDYNYYTLGVVENSNGLVITDQPSHNSTILYNAVSGGNTWTKNYPVLIVGEEGDYYKIKTDVPVKSDYKKYTSATDRLYFKTATGVEYDWDSEENITYGYIKKSYVTYINNPTTKYRDPKNTTSYTQRKAYSSFVSHFYEVVHGRKPDEEGLNFWVNKLMSNSISVGQLVREFVASKEFQSKNYSNEQYINVLYQLVHRRLPDASGKHFWLEKLNKGVSRDYIIVGFVNSTEFKNLCAEYGVIYKQITYQYITDRYEDITFFVKNFYLKAHKREVDNDGLVFWVKKLAEKQVSGQKFALEIFMSNEMTNRNLSNSEYVERLYQTILMRNSDVEGKKFWVNKLNNGVSRENIILELTNSTEYLNKCKTLGILTK